MKKFTSHSYLFSPQKGKKIVSRFDGGSISSNGGAILLREIDRKLNLLSSVAKVIPDKRNQKLIDHTIVDMLRQRVFGIALGYEDLNDHDTLRHDDVMQVCVGTDTSLASKSTLCRFENSVDKQIAFDVHKILVDQFIASYDEPPKEIVLDFDATDDLVHGNQIGRFFQGTMEIIAFCHSMYSVGNSLL